MKKKFAVIAFLGLCSACGRESQDIVLNSENGGFLISPLAPSDDDDVTINAVMETSTSPTVDFQKSFSNNVNRFLSGFANHETIKKILIELKNEAGKFFLAKANDILFNAVSDIGYSYPFAGANSGIGVRLKRSIIENPLRDLQAQIPDIKIPAVAIIDHFSINMGFPIYGTTPPAVTGPFVGFALGTSGTMEVLNMRTFTDPRAKDDYGVLNSKTKEWILAKLIPKWIRSHTPGVIKTIEKESMENHFLDATTKENVNRYSTLTNLLSFPIRLPFSRANAKNMYLHDVFAYDASGVVAMGVNLAYGVFTPGAPSPTTKIITLVPGASVAAGVGATAYLNGKWRVAIQKTAPGVMKVKLTESKEMGVAANASVGASLGLMVKVKLKDGIELSPGASYAYKFINFDLSRARQKTFSKTYQYAIGEGNDSQAEQDAWQAYTDALHGNFETSENMIYKYASSYEKPVVFIEEMDEVRNGTTQSGALKCFVASWERASTVQIFERNLKVDDVEIYSLSSYVEHRFSRSHLTWGVKTKRKEVNSVFPSLFSWANRTERFIFAINRRIKYAPRLSLVEDPTPEVSLLARWNYDDNEVKAKDTRYLDGFFNKIFGYTEPEYEFVDTLYNDFGSSVPQDLPTESVAQRVPFSGQMSVGMLPLLLKDTYLSSYEQSINPLLLMYKAFAFDPDAVPKYPGDIYNPWLVDTVDMPIPWGVKFRYPSAIRDLKATMEAAAAGEPKTMVAKFSKLVSHASSAPQMFAFISYLTAATINGTDTKPYMGNIFTLTKPDVINGQEIPKAWLKDRLSLDFSAVSGEHRYAIHRNSEVFNQVMTEVLNSSKPSIDLAM